jgi:hypothetical protein
MYFDWGWFLPKQIFIFNKFNMRENIPNHGGGRNESDIVLDELETITNNVSSTLESMATCQNSIETLLDSLRSSNTEAEKQEIINSLRINMGSLSAFKDIMNTHAEQLQALYIQNRESDKMSKTDKDKNHEKITFLFNQCQNYVLEINKFLEKFKFTS